MNFDKIGVAIFCSAFWTIFWAIFCLANHSSQAFGCTGANDTQTKGGCWIDRPDIFYDWLLGTPRALPGVPTAARLYLITERLPKGPIIVPLPPTKSPPLPPPLPATLPETLPEILTTTLTTTMQPAHSPPTARPSTTRTQTQPISKPTSKSSSRPTSDFHSYRVTTYLDSDLNTEILLIATASTEYRPATRSAQWEMMVNEYGITLQHDADWTRLSDGAGLFEPFETSLRIEAYCFCKLDGPAIAYDGSASMHFDPASLVGALSGITLTSPDGPALDGHLSFLAKKPDKDLLRDNAVSLTLGQAGKPQQWDSDIVFRAVATGSTGLADGYFAALHHNANAAISAYFYSTATPASDDGKEN